MSVWKMPETTMHRDMDEATRDRDVRACIGELLGDLLDGHLARRMIRASREAAGSVEQDPME